MLVDLFCGASAPVSSAAAALGLCRLEPLDLLHGSGFDLLNDSSFDELCTLAASGLVGAACAAPPCSSFSRARLRPGGPRPVRTPQYPTGIPSPSATQQAEIDLSSTLHSRTRTFLACVASRGGIILLENPSSSLLWKDPAVQSWLRIHAPFSSQAAACHYGLSLFKSWTFWSNFPAVESLACMCQHPAGFHPSFAGKRLPDGSFATRRTACYPSQLAQAIIRCVQPWLTLRPAVVPLTSWRHPLPSRFVWPQLRRRIEDGAGTCSSASWQVPRERDFFKDLRHAWLRRILQPGFIPSVLSRLNSDAKAPPLSPAELLPFFDDLRSWLQISDQALWSKLLEIDDGQPFRLNLWHALSLIGSDPDSAFFDLLHTGVPLGIGTPIPVCSVLPPPVSPTSPVTPLQHCDSAWQSAIDNADIVDKLLEEELSEGWIRLVSGGDAELRRKYAHSAVGKLGVVLSDDRPPRLVVDSSISGVTDHTVLPNRAPNPTLQDVRRCLPLDAAQEELCALVLDVSKAHRRVRIRPADCGLLCFRHRDRLYQSVTLNFGARASGYYWNRVAGLLVRFLHRLLFSAHSAFIYVDDILALLDRCSAPVWACLLVVAILVLNVPMSWHKASLSSRVTWIGWQFDFRRFTVRLDPTKLKRLQFLLQQLCTAHHCSLALLEKITGKLLWLSSLFRAFRPSLAPLYLDQHLPLPAMSAVSPDVWHQLRSSLTAELIISKPLPLAALPVGTKLLRVAHTPVKTLADVPISVPSRRVWVQTANPARPERALSESSREVLSMWLDLCNSGDGFCSALLPPSLECEAYADACACASTAGLGGFVRLPDGRQCCFQHSFSAAELANLFPWFPADASPQHFIASWELAAQVALLWCMQQMLGPSHLPVHCVFRTDNSASESACWKALSMARGMCVLLRTFFLLQRRFHISVHLDCVPGFLNVVADRLSRGSDPSSLGFSGNQVLDVPWSSFPAAASLHHFPEASAMPSFL